MIPFNFLLADSDKPVTMLIGNLLTLIIVLIVCKQIPIYYIYDFMLAKDLYFRLIFCNILISNILIMCLYRINLSNTIILFPIITVYLTLVVIFNIILKLRT